MSFPVIPDGESISRHVMLLDRIVSSQCPVGHSQTWCRADVEGAKQKPCMYEYSILELPVCGLGLKCGASVSRLEKCSCFIRVRATTYHAMQPNDLCCPDLPDLPRSALLLTHAEYVWSSHRPPSPGTFILHQSKNAVDISTPYEGS